MPRTTQYLLCVAPIPVVPLVLLVVSAGMSVVYAIAALCGKVEVSQE